MAHKCFSNRLHPLYVDFVITEIEHSESTIALQYLSDVMNAVLHPIVLLVWQSMAERHKPTHLDLIGLHVQRHQAAEPWKRMDIFPEIGDVFRSTVRISYWTGQNGRFRARLESVVLWRGKLFGPTVGMPIRRQVG